MSAYRIGPDRSRKNNIFFGEKEILSLTLFISRVIDSLIAKVNEDLGKDWIRHVEEMESRIADLIPYIE